MWTLILPSTAGSRRAVIRIRPVQNSSSIGLIDCSSTWAMASSRTAAKRRHRNASFAQHGHGLRRLRWRQRYRHLHLLRCATEPLSRERRARRFTEEAQLQAAAFNANGVPIGAMGSEAADLDNDGAEDLFVTSYTTQLPLVYKTSAHSALKTLLWPRVPEKISSRMRTGASAQRTLITMATAI